MTQARPHVIYDNDIPDQPTNIVEDLIATVTTPSDPETSHGAADSVTDLTEKQEAVFRVLEIHGPGSDASLSYWYTLHGVPRQSESGLRTRRAELVRKGLVRDTGETEVLPSGRRAIIWEAT